MSRTPTSHGEASGEGLTTSSAFATQLIAELVRLGVRDLVVCPGSRSQALALAAAEAEQLGYVRLHVRIDERSAAFFALGVARETGVAAPVIVTSGTSVANLLPAALEAHEARVPMLFLAADRPKDAHGVRTSQTTRQAGLAGSFARLSLDAAPPQFATDNAAGKTTVECVSTLLGGGKGASQPSTLAVNDLALIAWNAAHGSIGADPAGPAQLNLAFRDPLSGPGDTSAYLAALIEAGIATGAASRAVLDAEADIVTDIAGTPDTDVAPVASPVAVSTTGISPKSEFGSEFGSAAVNATFASGSYEHRSDALAVVVAGEGAGAEAEDFAHSAGLPLLAEVVSGSRFGRESVTAYAALLDDPAVGGLIEQVIVFGHPTLTRQVSALMKRDDVDVVVVDPHRGDRVDHFNPGRNARIVPSASVAEDHDARALRRWLGAWIMPDRELQAERTTMHEPDLEAATASGYKERNAYARAEVAAMREPISRELLAESVWMASWPHDRLVLAASRLVRVLDELAPARRLRVHSNRGLAGIDGIVATALGVAATSQSHEDETRSAGTTRVLLGDLSLLHDAGSLQLTPGETQPRIQLIVGNDGGGTIFDGLEVAGSANADAFQRVMYTPQSVSLEQLAAAYGWAYQRVETRVELERLFTVPVTGPMIVEIPLAR